MCFSWSVFFQREVQLWEIGSSAGHSFWCLSCVMMHMAVNAARLGRWNCPWTHSRFQFQVGTQMVMIKAGNVEAAYVMWVCVCKVVGHYSFYTPQSHLQIHCQYCLKLIFRVGRLLLTSSGVSCWSRKVMFRLTKTVDKDSANTTFSLKERVAPPYE